jgi:hypothetical protein
LRILALFAMPSRTSVLALRRERYDLSYRARLLAKQTRKAVYIRVPQYGVTRERLWAFAEEPPGWEVLHIAGHGEHGAMLLEKPDGTPDPVSIDDLVTLLRLARREAEVRYSPHLPLRCGQPPGRRCTGSSCSTTPTTCRNGTHLQERCQQPPRPWLPARYTSLRVCPSSVGGAGTCGTRISASRISIRRTTSACHRSSGRVSALRRLNGWRSSGRSS